MSESDLLPVRRALLSVSDKTGIVELAQFLTSRGTQILSTGGTAHLLRKHQIAVAEVSDYTRFPEIMDGRLKTLHPKVHGGLLGRGERDCAAMLEHGIEPIDLLVVNLYPFERTVGRVGVSFEEGVENIDVGGPAMIRAASKNHEHVAVVVDPADYEMIMHEIRDGGGISRTLRLKLAAGAFQRTAAYDVAIGQWLGQQPVQLPARPPAHPPAAVAGGDWPATLKPSFARVSVLRYGENPHQRAAFYTDSGDGLAGAEQLQGKALSYNNIADASAACECAACFDAPVCVIVKHATPCGVACAASPDQAYRRAVEADPASAFGGIVAFNRALDAQTAREIVARQFAEVVIVPEVAKDVLKILGEKTALRVLTYTASSGGGCEYRSVLGGVLVQACDCDEVTAKDLTVATKKPPRESELEDLLFAWRVVRWVKSNAIVFAHDAVTTGIGAGQTSRVDSVRIAAEKSREHGFTGKPLVMASDAFFPFRDGIDAAVEAGVTAVIQPGGSVHDDKVIAAADEHGITMVFTGVRHFRH